MDDVEDRGLISIPKPIKKDNTPISTTGIIVQLGSEIPCYICGAVEHAHTILPPEELDHPFESTFKVGDMIMFPKFGGTDFRIENEDFIIMEAREIMCTMVAVDKEGGAVEWRED